MNLKEAYRYANYLEELYRQAVKYITDRGFVTNVEKTHFRSKSNPEAADETVIVKKPFDVDFTPMDVINIMIDILGEREALAEAIAVAKREAELNIDNAVSMNKKRQNFVAALRALNDIKTTERNLTERAFRFNINNEQVPYYYDVVEKTTIDFDRNQVKALIKKYNKISDEISAKLDNIEISTLVNFEPKWDVNDRFEDIIRKYHDVGSDS